MEMAKRPADCGVRSCQAVGIGATNDGCNRDNRSIIVETVFRYKTVKAAAFTHMCKLNSRYVVGDSPCLCGDTTNLIWWHEKKLGLLVDKSCNEPRAGNSVNHWTFSSNPFHHMSPQAETLMPPRLLLTVLPRASERRLLEIPNAKT